jgi:hypothetical protein
MDDDRKEDRKKPTDLPDEGREQHTGAENPYRVPLKEEETSDGKSSLSGQDMDPGGPEVEERNRSDMH